MITYILKSSISLVVLFGLYWFLLRREKLFIFNRVFLIFSIIFSLTVPFVSIPVSIDRNDTQGNIITTLNNAIPYYNPKPNTIIGSETESVYNSEPLEVKTSQRISYTQILILLYIAGVLVLLIRFLRNIFFIYRQIRKSEIISYSGQRLVLTSNQINPFCFFNIIFVSSHDYRNNAIAEELLTHEIEHIRQSHSVDVIFIELIKIIYWFNPVLILYSRAIRVNHEYLADNGVISRSTDIKEYADKLLNYISCKRNVPLTSGINPSLTRKRLIMLTKSRSGKINYGARIFATVCLAAFLLLALGFTPVYSQPVMGSSQQQQEKCVSQELLKEYQDILNKYKRTTKDGENSFHLSQNMPEKERLETIFFQMSKEQQSKQMFVFVPKSSMVLPKSTPTVKQFESFKDPKKYGVWIDDIKVNNTELNKYKNTDFSYMMESILLKNAKDYGKFDSQVNLMTNAGYQKYYDKAINEKGNILVPNKINQNTEAPELKVEYAASADIKQDSLNQILILKGDAIVSFGEITIKADSIVFNKRTNQVFASGRKNSSGILIGKPVFKEGTTELVADEITYNLKTRKTLIKNVEAQVNLKPVEPTGNKISEIHKDEPQLSVAGVVSATNMNVLYLGIPNPIEIAVPGITSDRVTATTTNGTIIKNQKRWAVMPQSMEDVVLTILVDNIKVNEKIFRVKPIPEPVAVLAGKNVGSISKDVIKAATLGAELKDFLWDLKFEIESFTFFYSGNGFDNEITSKGNKLTDEMKTVISDLKSGQSVIFKDIKAIGPGGNIFDLSPIILKID